MDSDEDHTERDINDTQRDEFLAAARDAILAPDSDLDLAVLLPPERDIPDFLQAIAAVSRRVGRDVDLVNLRRAGDVLRREVLAGGKALPSETRESLTILGSTIYLVRRDPPARIFCISVSCSRPNPLFQRAITMIRRSSRTPGPSRHLATRRRRSTSR
jgi:predicted nucleotidyltransferase